MIFSSEVYFNSNRIRSCISKSVQTHIIIGTGLGPVSQRVSVLRQHYLFIFVNPRCACAARVSVVGFVCVSVKSHLTYGASVRPVVTYSAGNEGKKIC